jgi:two-component system response regulator (stage 0 sporulation protein A)
MESKIRKIVLQLGVPQHLKGYKYIKTAVRRVCANPDELDAVTKCLYPEVAKEHKTTPSRVERAIRHAIEWTFLYSDPDALTEIFGNSVYRTGKVTNSQFIAAIAELVEDTD